MDNIDTEILSHLESDSRTPFLQIAKDIGVSEGTIRKRVKAMLESGAIKGFTVIKGDSGRVKAFVFIKAKRIVPSTSRRIASLPTVKNVYEVSGTFDIVAYLEATSTESINTDVDAIRKAYGVVSTTTAFVLV